MQACCKRAKDLLQHGIIDALVVRFNLHKHLRNRTSSVNRTTEVAIKSPLHIKKPKLRAKQVGNLALKNRSRIPCTCSISIRIEILENPSSFLGLPQSPTGRSYVSPHFLIGVNSHD